MQRATKIIATVGPSTDSETRIAQLVAAGVDVFRLNFSHGTHESHGEVIRRIREAAQRAERAVAIMQDLSGPKIRTGRLRDRKPIDLCEGESLTIAVGDFTGEPGRVSTTYAGLPAVVCRAVRGHCRAVGRNPSLAAALFGAGCVLWPVCCETIEICTL